jgi:intracellular sulfur oxidation DsrE/DsrF family protein
MVAALVSQGVEFRVCNNTLNAFNIEPNKVIQEAKVVPSGVAEVARLQSREGYVYIHP